MKPKTIKQIKRLVINAEERNRGKDFEASLHLVNIIKLLEKVDRLQIAYMRKRNGK
jgi:hypothetical protein